MGFSLAFGTVLENVPEILRHAPVVMHLARGAGWPRGAWVLGAAASLSLRRELRTAGYEIMEDTYGRLIVEPPDNE